MRISMDSAHFGIEDAIILTKYKRIKELAIWVISGYVDMGYNVAKSLPFLR